jgi:hypothetical protein
MNARDILTRLLSDEVIDVVNLDLIPLAQLFGLQILIETTNEALNLLEVFLSQTSMLSAKLQVCRRLRQTVVSSYGSFSRKDVFLREAVGSSPAKKGSKAMLDCVMVVGSKTELMAIGFSACTLPRIMANPVINELAILLRPKLVQGFQAEASQEALQASQMFSPTGNGAFRVAAGFQVSFVVGDP